MLSRANMFGGGGPFCEFAIRCHKDVRSFVGSRHSHNTSSLCFSCSSSSDTEPRHNSITYFASEAWVLTIYPDGAFVYHRFQCEGFSFLVSMQSNGARSSYCLKVLRLMHALKWWPILHSKGTGISPRMSIRLVRLHGRSKAACFAFVRECHGDTIIVLYGTQL